MSRRHTTKKKGRSLVRRLRHFWNSATSILSSLRLGHLCQNWKTKRETRDDPPGCTTWDHHEGVMRFSGLNILLENRRDRVFNCSTKDGKTRRRCARRLVETVACCAHRWDPYALIFFRDLHIESRFGRFASRWNREHAVRNLESVARCWCNHHWLHMSGIYHHHHSQARRLYDSLLACFGDIVGEALQLLLSFIGCKFFACAIVHLYDWWLTCTLSLILSFSIWTLQCQWQVSMLECSIACMLSSVGRPLWLIACIPFSLNKCFIISVACTCYIACFTPVCQFQACISCLYVSSLYFVDCMFHACMLHSLHVS